MKKIVLITIISLSLLLLGCVVEYDNTDDDTLYSDYENYELTNAEDIDNLNVIMEEWNEVIDSYEMYTNEGLVLKLAEVGEEYANTYEFYVQHQEDYIIFLEGNKEDLEYFIEDFSVVERKREIKDNNLEIQQNLESMESLLLDIIESFEQQNADQSDIDDLMSVVQIISSLYGVPLPI